MTQLSPEEVMARKIAYGFSSKSDLGIVDLIAKPTTPEKVGYVTLSVEISNPREKQKLAQDSAVIPLIQKGVLHEGDLLGVYFTVQPILAIGEINTGRRTRDFTDSLVPETVEYDIFKGIEKTLHLMTPKSGRTADVIYGPDNIIYISMASIHPEAVDDVIKQVSPSTFSISKLTDPEHAELVRQLVHAGSEVAQRAKNLTAISDGSFQVAAKNFLSQCDDVARNTGIDQVIPPEKFKGMVAEVIGLRL